MRAIRSPIASIAATVALAALPIAGTAQTALGISGDVVQDCTITLSSPSINLPNYDFALNKSADDTATDSGAVSCGSTETPLDISFGSDTKYDSPYTLAMTGPSSIIIRLTATYTAAAGGMPFTITADAPANQDPSVGSYTGGTTVNVDF